MICLPGGVRDPLESAREDVRVAMEILFGEAGGAHVAAIQLAAQKLTPEAVRRGRLAIAMAAEDLGGDEVLEAHRRALGEFLGALEGMVTALDRARSICRKHPRCLALQQLAEAQADEG